MKLNIQKLENGNKVAKYLQHKQDSVRNQALINFNNLNGAIIPKVLNPDSEEDWYNHQNNQYKDAIRHYLTANRKSDRHEARKLWKEVQQAEDILKKGYPKYVNGQTCISTATGCYPHRVNGNWLFAVNPSKYGFKEILESDRLPGDLVQEYVDGYPVHALLYSGNNKFNYSNGGWEGNPLYRNSNYKSFNGILKYFRFIGTDEDKKKWENEAKY